MEKNNKLREAVELAKSTFETLIQFQGDEGFVKTWAELGRDAMIAALATPATAERSSAVGDAAKLREALEAIISGYENADLCDMNYGEWCHDPANVCVNVPLCKAIHEARAALSAPPRNCDRPECATTKAAQEVWRREDGGKTAYYEWLLAPATEKEGGDDGK